MELNTKTTEAELQKKVKAWKEWVKEGEPDPDRPLKKEGQGILVPHVGARASVGRQTDSPRSYSGVEGGEAAICEAGKVKLGQLYETTGRSQFVRAQR